MYKLLNNSTVRFMLRDFDTRRIVRFVLHIKDNNVSFECFSLHFSAIFQVRF